ncbi:hypothetical protein ANANG_G00238880 [Anguilla anguilla]|uniref:Uncharacterized protein n=1 Tax=Anguilla anguilla TaxID=7936 RepID=A0A9D3RRW9_ANGAN|nr:hypothetical protein ANANG_G00238880 [Anguilla anguilla]
MLFARVKRSTPTRSSSAVQRDESKRSYSVCTSQWADGKCLWVQGSRIGSRECWESCEHAKTYPAKVCR